MGEAFQESYVGSTGPNTPINPASPDHVVVDGDNDSTTVARIPEAGQLAPSVSINQELSELVDKMVPAAHALDLGISISQGPHYDQYNICITSPSNLRPCKTYPLSYKGVYDAGYYLMEERCRRDLIRRMPDIISSGWYLSLDIPNPEYLRTRGFFIARNDSSYGKFYLYTPSCVEDALRELPRKRITPPPVSTGGLDTSGIV